MEHLYCFLIHEERIFVSKFFIFSIFSSISIRRTILFLVGGGGGGAGCSLQKISIKRFVEPLFRGIKAVKSERQ